MSAKRGGDDSSNSSQSSTGSISDAITDIFASGKKIFKSVKRKVTKAFGVEEDDLPNTPPKGRANNAFADVVNRNSGKAATNNYFIMAGKKYIVY